MEAMWLESQKRKVEFLNPSPHFNQKSDRKAYLHNNILENHTVNLEIVFFDSIQERIHAQ